MTFTPETFVKWNRSSSYTTLRQMKVDDNDISRRRQLSYPAIQRPNVVAHRRARLLFVFKIVFPVEVARYDGDKRVTERLCGRCIPREMLEMFSQDWVTDLGAPSRQDSTVIIL